LVPTTPTIHACAVLVGGRAILIRGPAGSGKSRLVLGLIHAAETGLIPFARLVADDRVALEVAHGRLLARPPQALAGLIEVRGLGIRQVPHDEVAVVNAVVDLSADDAQRLPEAQERQAEISGIRLPRVAVPPGLDPLPVVLAFLRTGKAGVAAQSELGGIPKMAEK
jgi:serine kinase of HPr protein (carbohydrate metabolism regulator)